jgi:predicted Zn-dependent protease
VIYGEDPREGMLLGATFAHPREGFAIDLPAGWKATSDGPRVMAVAPDEQAIMVLVPSVAESAKAGLDGFFADGSIERGEAWDGKLGGFAVASAGFSVASSSGGLSGLLAFIDYDEDTVLALAAMGPTADWAARSEVIAGSFASFRRAEKALLEVEPMRVRLYELAAATSLLALQGTKPSAIDLPRLALLNGIEDPTASLPEGTVVKRVEGFNPAARAPK